MKPNQQLPEKQHKLIVKKLEKRKLQSSFRENILHANLADMQFICKFNKGIRFF